MKNQFSNIFFYPGVFIMLLIMTGCGSKNNETTNNKAPIISGNNKPYIETNSIIIAQYTAKDDSGSVEFSLAGPDSPLFIINKEGEVKFAQKPNLENEGKGTYHIYVVAIDKKGLATKLNVTITVVNKNRAPSSAVVQTVASDFSRSQVAYIEKHELTDLFYIKGSSDFTLNVFKNNIFHMNGRTISKYKATNKNIDTWTYSTELERGAINRQPYSLISLNKNKAYLIRNRSSKVLVVNPQAETEENFKIGELDLSAYTPADSTTQSPRPAEGIIVDGKLFIAMQRRNATFGASNINYLAVYDTKTDLEIETNSDPDDDLKGIPLKGIHPLGNSLDSHKGKIYITTNSTARLGDIKKSMIEEVDTLSYVRKTVLTAADIPDNTKNVIQGSVVISKDKGYFFTTNNSTLHQFNPQTGKISSLEKITNNNPINFIAHDKNDFLWISIADSNPRIHILDTYTNTLFSDNLRTQLNPQKIAFIQ